MSLGFDDLQVGGQLRVGTGICPPIKEGDTRINGSMMCEGPGVFGGPTEFPGNSATIMIGRTRNNDVDCTPADHSLHIKGDIKTKGDATNEAHVLIDGTKNTNALVVEGHQTINNGNLHTSNLLTCTFQGLVGTGGAFSGSTINTQGWKGFDIAHPSRPGYRLRHICLEGPEGAIYTRGRVVNKNVIYLPDYWKDLVDHTTISVQLQPIGAHQNVIVKRVESTKIHLQAQGGMPINCYYHVFGERQDIERLVVEYEGTSPADYPGDNSKYQIAGYNHDITS